MKLIKGLALGLSLVGMVSCSGQKEVARATSLNSEIDSASYALGQYAALNFRIDEDFKNLNYDLFVQALKESKDTANVLLPQNEVTKILVSYTKKQAEARGAEAKAKGEAFLAENAKKEGITVTDSGLQYSVIKEGTGDKPVATDKVRVHYHGTTPEGEVFDSSVDRGTPTEFALNQVIKGWTEGLQLMSVGSKYKFFIPSDLGYGINAPQGGRGPIKANMPLVFEVELLDIIK